MWLLLLRQILMAVAAGLLLLGHATAQTPTRVIELNAGINRIEAEVASTIGQRAQGLMHRKSMPANHGMLFVFPETGVQCFWMKNTLIPLSIAFLDENGRIVSLAEMQPQSLDNHCSGKPVRYALEMNTGWFRQRGFAVGTMIGGLANAAYGR